MKYTANFHLLLCTFRVTFLICLVFSLCPEYGSFGHNLHVSEENGESFQLNIAVPVHSGGGGGGVCWLIDEEEFGLLLPNSEHYLRVHKRSHACLKPQLMLLKGRSSECPPIIFILSIEVNSLAFARHHGWLARFQKCWAGWTTVIKGHNY